jgi:hypothetical protein
MSSTSPSGEPVRYESARRVASTAAPGVHFTIRRMSFGRRTELLRRVRELTQKREFLEAGAALGERVEAALVGREADRVYLEWGLLKVEGLDIDGEPATPESLLASGPEPVTEEILRAIQAECGLSAEERKN